MDVVLEMSGVPSAIHQAFALVRVGGRVQMLGIPAKPMEVDFATEVIFKGITIYGVVGRRMYDTWHQMTRFLRSGEFDPTPVITHRFPLEEADEAIARDQERRGGQSHLRDRIDGPTTCAVSAQHTLHVASLDQRRSSSSRPTASTSDSTTSSRRSRARVRMEGRGEVLILSSNNYLGLCDEPAVIDAGHRRRSTSTARARGACGSSAARSRSTASSSRRSRVSSAPSRRCQLRLGWNANEGLTATIVEEGDFVVSDALNHASIIDSMRLAKAITKCTTAVYKHSDMDDLRAKLARATAARGASIIWTDGVFSMEGEHRASCPRSSRSRASTTRSSSMDDSHATGVLGQDRPRHGRALRRARRGGHHHVDARQGARRRGGRIRRRAGRAHATI